MQLRLFIFLIYLAVLFKLLFFKLTLNYLDISITANTTASFYALLSSSNFIPFFRIYYYLSGQEPYLVGALNLLGNIAIFLPFGFFLPHFFRSTKRSEYFFLCVTIFSLCIELLQLFTGTGQFDIDDVILNVTGAWLGFYLYGKNVFAYKGFEG